MVLNVGMPMTLEDVKDHIRVSSFLPDAKRQRQAAEIVWNALTLFRENKTRKYVSHAGKLIKKPSPTHAVPMGRYDQKDIRTVLISAICRAWMVGVDHEPTLNNKKEYDSAFMTFAFHILALEGIGHIHKHLEEYWSIRKHEWLKNTTEPEKWRLSGGSETIP